MSPESSGLATLHPAYFALVMATGIVSIACQLLGFGPISVTLLWANTVFYVILWILTGLRIQRYPDRIKADFSNHGRAVGFFTVVAATSILGTQWLVIAGVWSIAAWLWAATIILWT